MNFEFATAGRVTFGPGTSARLPEAVGELGRRVLVVTDRDASRVEPSLDALRRAGLHVCSYAVRGEPLVDDVVTALTTVREERCDAVLGIGGGSALDAAKAVAALATNPGDPFDYLEVVGRGQSLAHPPLPCVAVPTTAGTGAEVTRNAVLSAPEHRVKVSLRGPYLLPRLALVDPVLTHGVPPDVTARTGMDALAQVIEPYVSARANPFTDGLCLEAMARAARALPRVFRDGHDAAAREDMALVSLFGGLALANAGLGAVHGFAGPIGGMFDAPHGAVCGALLPPVMQANVRALRERLPGSEILARYRTVAKILTGDPDAEIEDGARWVEDCRAQLGIPPLTAYGIGSGDVGEVVEKAQRASSMKANPVLLTAGELRDCLQAALSFS